MKRPDPLDAVFAAIVATTGKPKPPQGGKGTPPVTPVPIRATGKTDKPRKAAAMTPAELVALMEAAKMEPVDLWRPLGISYRSLRFYLDGERRISKPVAIAIRRVCAQARKKLRTS